MASRDGRWAALLGAVERLRVAVEETERMARRSSAVPPAIVATLDVIHRRLVTDLRPLVLRQLEDGAGSGAAPGLRQAVDASLARGASVASARRPPEVR
jgi:hypothetical protein